MAKKSQTQKALIDEISGVVSDVLVNIKTLDKRIAALESSLQEQRNEQNPDETYAILCRQLDHQNKMINELQEMVRNHAQLLNRPDSPANKEKDALQKSKETKRDYETVVANAVGYATVFLFESAYLFLWESLRHIWRLLTGVCKGSVRAIRDRWKDTKEDSSDGCLNDFLAYILFLFAIGIMVGYLIHQCAEIPTPQIGVIERSSGVRQDAEGQRRSGAVML